MRAPPPALRDCRKILVVKLDYVGDWVLFLPFLGELRRNAPQAQITAVVLDRVFALAASCRWLDRVVAVSGGRIDEAVGTSAAEAAAFIADYRSGAFDLALVPRWDADFNGASQLAAGSGAPAVVGFSERCTKRKRRLNRNYDRFYTHSLDHRVPDHEARQSLRLLEFLGCRIGPPVPVGLEPGPADERAAAAFLRSRFGDEPDRVIAVAPFASEPKRTLPSPLALPLGRLLAAKFEGRFVIIGGAQDAARGARLAAALGGRAVSACGHLHLAASAALLGRCAAAVATDSGPAHIAAAVGTPVIVLSCHPAHGNPAHENAPQRFAPLRGRAPVAVLQPPRAAAPCADACRASMAHCIGQISPGQVVRALERVLAAAPHADLPRAAASGPGEAAVAR